MGVLDLKVEVNYSPLVDLKKKRWDHSHNKFPYFPYILFT